MCQETNFEYDKCDHRAPRPARTTKCALAEKHRECHTKEVLVKLSSKKDCPKCLGYRKLQKLIKARNLHIDDMDDNGYWKIEDVSLNTIIRDAYTEKDQARKPMPVPAPEVDAKKSFLTRCCTWPSSDHRLRTPSKPEELQWQVPTKCFIDVGFVRLDPWAADREKLRLEAEGKRDQQNLEQRDENGRRASLPDLQQVFQDCCASMAFTRPEPVIKVGSCCMETKRRMEARDSQAECAESGRDRMSREDVYSDDWCTSKF